MKIGIITLDNQPVGTIDLAMLEQDPTLQPVLPNMEVGAEAPDDFMTPGQRGAGPPIHIPRGAGRRGRTRGGDDEDSKVEPQFSREKKLLREDVRKRHGLPPEKESRGPSEGVEGPAPKNADDTYKKIRDRFEHSSLSGYVPRDGAKWGITKGTPDEWARLAVALGMQES